MSSSATGTCDNAVPELPGCLPGLRPLRVRVEVAGGFSNPSDDGGLLEFFDHLLFSTDVGVRKPHPQIFQTALEALNVAPHEAVFVGDRFPEDVAGAKSVGMWGIWKERPDRERLPHVIPDAQIVDLRELLGILDSWTERHGA